MKADDSNITSLFGVQRVQYCIPHYQRPQAWKPREHWEPLWADIEAKASAWLDDQRPLSHYLGAIVLAKRPRIGVRGMDRNIVIDGQQRLSTTQYILKALSLLTKEHCYDDGTTSLSQELRNEDTRGMDQPEVQIYKLWPTFRDRHHHLQVMDASTYDELRQRFPGNFTKAGKLYVSETMHPRPLECTVFFYNKISEWVKDLPDVGAIHSGLEAIRRAVTESLQLIVLWLEEHDDPQVIFECLNGRGAPLRPTDLIKNFIFMSAEAEPSGKELGEDSPLFKLWSQLDGPEWLEPLTRGRLKQARLEWLIYYALQAETGQEIDTSRIYDSYQKWARPGKSGGLSAIQQVEIILTHARALQDFVGEEPSRPIGRLGKVAQALDVTTITPLALAIARSCDTETQALMFETLSSYLIRRETCQLTKKSYNLTFMQVLRELRKNGFHHDVLQSYLKALQGPTVAWPDDQMFTAAIAHIPIYSPGSSLCRLILAAVANRIGNNHPSELQWSPDWSQLHLEHLMPQSWFEHWPMPDGTFVSKDEAVSAEYSPKTDDAAGTRATAIVHRAGLINVLGNLTILNAEINQEIKNFDWSVKRQAILGATQLRMNYDIAGEAAWDESRIQKRGLELAEGLCQIFAGPDTGGGDIRQCL